MKSNLYILLFFTALAGSCKKTDDFLTRLPLDQMTDEVYWTSESNVRTYAWNFYANAFPGYSAGFDLGWGGYFSGETLNDDFAPTNPAAFTQNVPPTDTKWSFTFIRRANLMIDRVQKVPMSEEAIRHWTGIARFFRALEFANKVKTYGDFPWYNTVLEENDTEALYKPRDPRTLVMDSVLADMKYAAEHVRIEENDITLPAQLVVTKYTVLAFMSRVFLFEGTWQKYHHNNTAKATEYLEVAKWAANEVMTKGPFTIAPDYRKMFNSVDLNKNAEIIMYRRYDLGTGLVTHSLHTYVNKEPQTGSSKNAIEAYLCSDGLPVSLSPLYKGDTTVTNVMTNRDPRMYATYVKDVVRLNGVSPNPSTTGYAVHKFFNEELANSNEGLGQNNTTDAPVIRLGEVLLNYIEAVAELGTITQADLDKTINRLRKRSGIGMPDLRIAVSGLPAANGVEYDDPKRDPAVSPLLWEIRRERRIELMMEGFRTSDLRRWKKFEYADTKANSDINRGAWVNRANYPTTLNLTIENNASKGYIIPAPKPESQRVFNNARVYLSPLPDNQIKLYRDNGAELKQNAGW
jgi:starch-binding outer membrane protein, SusD/RagB family